MSQLRKFDILGELMSSAQAIEIKFFGTDIDRILDYSRQISKIVEKVPETGKCISL